MGAFLSIIIPAYNEEHRLPGSLAKIQKFLSLQSYPAEVLIVENGSSDRTYEIAKTSASNIPGFRLSKKRTGEKVWLSAEVC